eukprot:COSAG01_NODE_4672_length_4829_cov_3.623890_1_plen_1016_part_00
MLLQVLLAGGAYGSTVPAAQYDPSKFNEVWNTPSVEPGHGGGGWDKTLVLTVNGSQPLGNGDLTAVAFPELDMGRISVWLSKQDAISDDTSPFKLGQVSLSVHPNPWAGTGSRFFRQTLDFSTGTITVLAGGTGEADHKVKFEAWVDIDANVAHLTAIAGPGTPVTTPLTATATITALHPSVPWAVASGASQGGMTCGTDPLANGDVLMGASETGPHTIAIYHRNLPDEIMIDAALKQQQLESLRGTAADPARNVPLANRTFGVVVGGSGLTRGQSPASPANGGPGAVSVLQGTAGRSEWHVAVVATSAVTHTPAEWFAPASALLEAHKDDWQPTSHARTRTSAYWRSYWDRSHIDILNATNFAPPAPPPAPPPPPPSPRPACGAAVYCRLNTTLDGAAGDQICTGGHTATPAPLGTPCAGINKAWCPDYRSPTRRCIEIAEASCNTTERHGKPCVAFAIFEDWGVEYYSTSTTITASYAWTFFYRNPALYPTPAPSPSPSPPPPPPPSPAPSLGFQLSQNYALTRFAHAVQSRLSDSSGPRMPIKFNGEAFTMQRPPSASQPKSSCSASLGGCVEFRSWGPNSWWQNVRLSYYPMIPAGDFEHLVPIFEYYLRMLPFAKARTQNYFGHGGVFFTETKSVFGAFAIGDYGCAAERKPNYPPQLEANLYISMDYGGNAGSTEVSLMLLDHYYHTLDAATLRKYLPIAIETMAFFQAHYPIRNELVSIFPSQALETFWCDAASNTSLGKESWVNGSWRGPWNRSNCIANDAPTIAALTTLSEKLLQLPADFTTASQRAGWAAYAAALPPLPMRNSTLMAYANTVTFPPKGHNGETPQCYAIHPWRMFTVGRARASGLDLTPALNAAADGQPGWGKGAFPNAGWVQTIIHNALLGRADVVAAQLIERSLHSAVPGMRSRAFAWGQICGHPPAAEQMNNANTALNFMLLQPGDDGFDNATVFVFPAWPCAWDVDFKLAAPLNTTVSVRYVKGNLERFVVEPVARKSAVSFSRCVSSWSN